MDVVDYGIPTMTVDEWLLEELFARGLNAGEYERALEYAKQKLDVRYSANAYLDRKDGKDVLVKDCWQTPAINYTQKALDGLYKLIEFHTLTWCINYMHSLL
jgi:hypothetical protein